MPTSSDLENSNAVSDGGLAGVVAAFGVAYLLVAWLSIEAFVQSNAIAAMWPQSGLALAAMLLVRPGRWPLVLMTVFLADCAANMLHGTAPLISAGFAAANCGEALMCAWVFDRLCRRPIRFERVRDVFVLVVPVAMGANAVGSLSGAAVRTAAYDVGFWDSWFLWWTGDGVGMLVAAPVVLAWLAPRIGPEATVPWSRVLEGAALAVALTTIAQVVFGADAGVSRLILPQPGVYLLFPFLFWTALRFGARGAALASLCMAIVVVFNTVQGRGPIATLPGTLQQRMHEAQLFLTVATVLSLLLAAVTAERAEAARSVRSASRRTEETAAQLDTLLSGAPVGMALLDAQRRFLRVNNAFASISGLEPAVHAGRTLHDVLAQVGLQMETLVERVLTERSPQLNVELSATDPAGWGRSRHWLAGCYPVRTPDGPLLGVGIVVSEITERKRAEDRQAFMMRELDHRVKNNLASVVSLADHTIRSATSLDDFQSRFLGRVGALSRMHTLLARNSWDGMKLIDLVSQTLGAFMGPEEGRGVACGQLAADGPECVLPARAAGPLCMAMHELATNAAKYGALSTSSGRVMLSWSIEGAPGSPRGPRICWREEGGPPVTPPTRAGFGTSLITDMIAHELRGQVNLEFAPTGVVCTITIDFNLTSEPKPGGKASSDGPGLAVVVPAVKAAGTTSMPAS